MSGWLTLCFLLFILVVSIISCFNQIIKRKLKLVFNNKRINESLVASIIVLLFAFAFPFKQFPELLDCFSSLNHSVQQEDLREPFNFCFSVFLNSSFVKYGMC